MDKRVEGYLVGNRKWAASKECQAPITFKDMQKKGRDREDGTVIVVACTDPRVTPEEFLGMSTEKGNKATVVRVAGGRVDAAMCSLLVLSAVGNAGKKGAIVVVHHTDCGLATASDEEIRSIVINNVAEGDRGEARALVKGLEFGSIESPEKSLEEDVDKLRRSPFFTGMQIYGLLQDTETGLLEVKFDPSTDLDT
ncbi:uncharacterized protein LY89DRAFT_687695 [Mollisia scopiformis]|uniref:Carbonic anhydrase n=1 Tax=Mollisia scopiformis TaxID=149040 RepID=A0A194WYG9_MOLSC|nr:uncharacterized protein LY89DRAFT_687695 [Mollisia scopiformis]KUJ12734.1 hypothetical protein LY89DRAFT_687695 [Mollisia scopiformis]